MTNAQTSNDEANATQAGSEVIRRAGSPGLEFRHSVFRIPQFHNFSISTRPDIGDNESSGSQHFYWLVGGCSLGGMSIW
jgi:hypothetical protein